MHSKKIILLFTFSQPTFSQKWEHQNIVWNLFKTDKFTKRQWRSPGIVIINVEQVSHTDLMFLLLTVNKSTSAVLAGWKKVYYSANGQNLFGVNNPKRQNHFIDVISITLTVNFEKIQWSDNSPDVQAVNMLKSPSLVSAHTQIAIIIWDCLFS